MFLYSYPLNDISLVDRLCQSAFSPSAKAIPVSSTHLACTYGVLYFVLKEFISLSNPICQKINLNDTILSLCENNFNVLLEDSQVLGVPSFGSVLALTIGAIKAQIQAKPSLSCTLISTAACHCQNLRYNHDSVHGNSSSSPRLFWSVYMLEKQTSLFFGRASIIQDADVDAAYPIRAPKEPVRSWDDLFIKEINLSKVQSRIYEELYSRKALGLADSERERRVAELAVKLTVVSLSWIHLYLIDTRQRQLYRVSWELLETKYNWTSTTLLRAHSSSTAGQTHLKPECFKVARSALKSCLCCLKFYQKIKLLPEAEKSSDWGLLSCMLTPFIIITLHAIASSSTEDMTLLNNVVSTLQDIQSTSSSSACAKLYKLTASFSNVASGLVQRRASVRPGSGWRYSQQEDLLSFISAQEETDTRASTDGWVKKRPVSASSILSGRTDGRSLFHLVMDDYVLDVVGRAEGEELFGVLEEWMGGLVPGFNVFGS